MIQNQPAGVNSRVVGLIVKDRGLYAAMMGCVTPIQAFELYTRALQVFSTHAKQEIEQFTNHTLLIAERIDLEARVSCRIPHIVCFCQQLFLSVAVDQHLHLPSLPACRCLLSRILLQGQGRCRPAQGGGCVAANSGSVRTERSCYLLRRGECCACCWWCIPLIVMT